jgi:ABC-type transport system substrate-binding protein
VRSLLSRVGLISLATVVVMACGAGNTGSGSAAGSPAASAEGMAQYAPSGEAWIQAVDLGTNSQESFDPGQSGTQFPSGTLAVGLWYRWDGAEPAKRIDNRWYKDDALVLEQGEQLESASGTAAWFLKQESGGPLPDGAYKVELLEDGRVVTTIPFKVGS